MAETIRATRISGPGEFEYVTVDAPEPGRGEMLIRPLMLSICGSDIYMLHHEPCDSYPRDVGTTGHEMIGAVVKTGDCSDRLAPGDIALVLAPYHDGMCELYVAPYEMVLPLPEGRSIPEYLMAQQLGTVIYTCKRLPSVMGKTAVVIGQGSAGLFYNAMLKRLGATRVIALDIVADRLEFSKGFGADVVIDNSSTDPVAAVEDLTDGCMADLVVEAAGEVESINLAPKLVRTRGTIVFFGIPRARSFEFDYFDFFRRYATTITSSGAMLEPGKGSFSLALELIRNGAIDMSGIVTHTVPFDRLGEAYELARLKNDGVVKVAVTMPSYTADIDRI